MANNFISLAIYQIDGNGEYDSSFPIFRNFPVGGLFIRGITPPLNAARGVLCYGAVRSWAHGNHQYYTNLSMAEIVALANSASSNSLTTEDGTVLTDESNNPLTTES